MIKSIEEIEIFNNSTYQTYYDWKVAGNSGKDIVGKNYEQYLKGFYTRLGYDVHMNKSIAGYESDLVCYLDGDIKLIVEAKGHYVDKCFLKRALFNFAEIVSHYRSHGKDIPLLVIDSPTRFRNYNHVLESSIKIFSQSIRRDLKRSIKYLPMCDVDRIKKESYYDNSGFTFPVKKSRIDTRINTFKI